MPGEPGFVNICPMEEGEGKYFSDFGTAVINGIVAQTNQTTGLHYFSAENTNSFHAVPKDHQGYKLSRRNHHYTSTNERVRGLA